MGEVGIITFHNGSNYGAALQTFALQEALRDISDNVMIINYDNRFISKGLDTIRFDLSVRGIYYALTDVLNLKTNSTKIKRFKSFFNQYYILSELMDKEKLHKNGVNFDVGISGSDQIWNSILNNGVDDIYFLNIPGLKKKCSYASSIGSYKFDNLDYNEKICKLLKSYTNISVRENGELISAVINQEVRTVCDPTLLLSKGEWERKLSLKVSEEKYLLIYAMTDFQNVTEYAIKAAKKRNLKIKYIGTPVKKYKNIEYIKDAGPKEFVDLFFNEDYVVTNSFHGTAFSVNFGRQFVSLKNPKNPERAMYFLGSIKAEGRLVADYNYYPNDMTEAEIMAMHINLSNFIADSKEYIKLMV